MGSADAATFIAWGIEEMRRSEVAVDCGRIVAPGAEWTDGGHEAGRAPYSNGGTCAAGPLHRRGCDPARAQARLYPSGGCEPGFGGRFIG